ncbi:Mitogen-activated protein kinase kinase kinase MLT isoform X2 [Oopsacas minuta]|uniref:Mitogen-activated protein kinase kinase kinase MLT isoform X2 n=1 Tax=Oopsacas minuta TaxID=111878 RepID=A0AAV7JQ84_9METZ|nr:Mitogen-activated protein kinase kinase kinase MLT isoform X2 [Oopsacas minuta]
MSTICQLMSDDFVYIGPIGVGTFGTVVRATWKTKEKEVAIKRLPTLNPENREIQVLTSLRHKNIIQFFGLVRDNNGYGIVTELAENGSLYDFLRIKNKANETLDYDRVILWALDIARGMEYLHFQAPQTVIHRDLKSKNVVINSKFMCKLCDFGSSKFQQNSLREASTSIAGTMAWMAPEVIKESLVIEASDTYSFAIVLWELLTCRVPYDSLENIQVAWLVAMKGERPHLPAEVPQKFKMLIQNCWKEDHKERPNFQFLVKNLDNLKLDRDLQEKTALFLCNPEKWRLDIGDKNEKLMKQSNELTDKEKQLQIWERQLNIKEKKLFKKERRQQSQNTYQSLEKWTPKRVYEWIRELRKGEGDELEDQYVELANRFYAESIDGRALMLLGEEDLIKMKITGLGIRIDLLDSIKELRVSNQNLMNFPPLAVTLPTFTPQTVQNQSLKVVEIILIFGSICRVNTDIPRENKWKLYLELDGDESAIPTVQSVQFVINDKNWDITLTRPPFIMNRWLTADKLGMTECRVLYDDLIVVTPVESTHLFTPDTRDVTTEVKITLKIKTTSMTRMTPHNSLTTSELSVPTMVTTSSNQFEFSSELNRSGSSNLIEYKGIELVGSWANRSPGSLARMISSQTCPKRIVKGGPIPTSYSTTNLHPNSSTRSQSSMSHVSPRLSHGSSSLASSPSNSINMRFSSPSRCSSRTPVSQSMSRSATQSFSPTPMSQTPREKRHSLPAKHHQIPSPMVKKSFRYESNSNRLESPVERDDHMVNGVEPNNGREHYTKDKNTQWERTHMPSLKSEDSYQRYSSDTSSVDNSNRSRTGTPQHRDRRPDRRANYPRRNNRRRDDTRDYKRDDTRDYKRDDTRDYKRDDTRDYKRDYTRDNKRDDTRDIKRDDTLRRRDAPREYGGTDKKGQHFRRDDRTNNRKDRDSRKWEEGKKDRDIYDSSQYRRSSIPYQTSNSLEVKKKPPETENDSDSEWTVVAKNKSKNKPNYY